MSDTRDRRAIDQITCPHCGAAKGQQCHFRASIMTTKTINLYEFSELSDAAKKKAREWWRDCERSDFGAHGELTEPAETAGKLLGITFATGGGSRYEPKIYWDIGCTQGSGASFEGSYEYVKGAEKALRAEFGGDSGETLARIARNLQALQRRYRYHLTAKITTSGNYTHEYAMDVEVCDASGNEIDSQDDAREVLELMRDFARWIHAGILVEYESRMTDEYVDDAITANEYTFTESGERED